VEELERVGRAPKHREGVDRDGLGVDLFPETPEFSRYGIGSDVGGNRVDRRDVGRGLEPWKPRFPERFVEAADRRVDVRHRGHVL